MAHRVSTTAVVFCLLFSAAQAANYYVSTSAANASDAGPGSLAQPFKTIQHAATILQPGDTCFIRGGIYRETVQPARGGTSEAARIVYKAFSGEKPSIRGSEAAAGWALQSGTVYKADIPNSVFGSSNPFATAINDPSGWLWYGGEYHCGDVYIDGVSYYEKSSSSAVSSSPRSFYASVGASTTSIWVNYSGSATPATSLIEVNVRGNVFRPSATGCNYITLDGLEIGHSACNWTPCCGSQTAMVDVNGGSYWLVQNCHLMDARNCALCSSTNSNGFHLVRNNIIERCGQAGLIGMRGWFASVVEGNLIQDIDWKCEFGGAETAGMKTHYAIDLVIRNNIFRRVASPSDRHQAWQYALWFDYACQSVRLSGNVFYEIDVGGEGDILTESSHGPFLIDNNVFINRSGAPNNIKTSSDNMIVIHNLFVNSKDNHYSDSRSVSWYVPHTKNQAGSGTPQRINDKYYNNLFINTANNLPQGQGYVSDYNAYAQGSSATGWGDAHSVTASAYQTGFSYQSFDNGITMSFSMNSALLGVACPLVTNPLIGQLSPVNQGIEEHDGTPITINRDLFGNPRSATRPTVGPFENLVAGNNTFTIAVGIDQTRPYLALAPSSVTIAADNGSAPPPTVLDVKNMGSGTLDAVTIRLAIPGGGSWLTAQKSGNGNSQQISLQASTAGLPNGTYAASLIVSAANAGNDSLICPITMTITPAGTRAINAGGGAVAYFMADANYSGGSTYSSTTPVTTTGVANAAPAEVYQTERHGNFSYVVPSLEAGKTYTVRLHFAEIYHTQTGMRVFNVAINGTNVLSNFDIFAAAGAGNKAVVREFAATANSSGQITITFATVTDNALLCGLECFLSSPVRDGTVRQATTAPFSIVRTGKGIRVSIHQEGEHSITIIAPNGAIAKSMKGCGARTYGFMTADDIPGVHFVTARIGNATWTERIIVW